MTFLQRLLRPRGDDRATVRSLWHRVIAIAREPEWYESNRIDDTVAGRFDAITLVLSAVLLRMERDEALIPPSVRLTELFVDDMDGQLREGGVGDMGLSKRMGKLVSVLGGRLGAYRAALASSDPAMLSAAVARNVTLADAASAPAIASRLRELADQLTELNAEQLLAAEFAR